MPLKKIFSSKTAILFVLILLFGAFLRLYKLGAQSFIADEYIGINVSQSVAQTGQWKYWDFNTQSITDREYTRGQVYYWQVAQVLKFLGPSEANSRLISVMWGVIGIVLTFIAAYLATKNIYVALLAAFLSSISISNLIYDRKLRMYSMFAPIFLLFSYAVFYFLESKWLLAKKIFISKFSNLIGVNLYLLPVVLFLGCLAFLTHQLSVNIATITAVYVFILFLIEYKKERKINKYFWLLAGGIFGVIVFLKTKFIRGGLGSIDPSTRNWSYLKKVNLDYSYLITGLILMIFGIFYLWKKCGKMGIWTVLSFLVPLFSAIFLWDRNAGDQYIYLVQPFKIIIVATGLHFIAKNISEKIWTSVKYGYFAVAGLLLLSLINLPFFFSGEGFYRDPKDWDYPNYREGFQYFLQHKQPDDVLISRDLSNYYLSSSNTKIIDYGSDDKMTAQKIMDVQNNHSGVWMVTSVGDFNLKGDAKIYLEDNFELIETKHTNNELLIWKWPKSKKEK